MGQDTRAVEWMIMQRGKANWLIWMEIDILEKDKANGKGKYVHKTGVWYEGGWRDDL